MAAHICRISNRIIFSNLRRHQVLTRHFSNDQLPVNQELIGFIGLGNMGAPMAQNLLKKGHKLLVNDAVQSNMKQLEAEGASIAEHPAEIAQSCDIVITMLPSSLNVSDVYLGENGILRTVQDGSLLIDCSTISPETCKHVAGKSEEKNATFLDAPVSGGVVASQNATLTFLVGGGESGFNRAKPILECMGKNIFHCGGTSTGQAVKICNNMLLAISMLGVSEALNLGMKLGLDPKLLSAVINVSSGRCWSSEIYNPCPGVVEAAPSSKEYKGGFGTALMTKDLGLAQDAATNSKTPTPLGSLAHQLYRTMCNQGYGHLDFSSAFKFLQEK